MEICACYEIVPESHLLCWASREASSLPSNGSVHNFTTLQQHIDELTQEKFELQRGMDTQGKLTQSLAQENQILAEQFNKQGQVVEQLRKKIEQYEAELQAHGLALESVANERDACRTGAQETQERVKVRGSCRALICFGGLM